MNPLLKFAASIHKRLPGTAVPSRAQGQVAVEAASPRRLARSLSLPDARSFTSAADGKKPPLSGEDRAVLSLVLNRARFLTRMEAEHCLREPTQDVRAGLLAGCLNVLRAAQGPGGEAPEHDALQSRIDVVMSAPGEEGKQARRAVLQELVASIEAHDRKPV